MSQALMSSNPSKHQKHRLDRASTLGRRYRASSRSHIVPPNALGRFEQQAIEQITIDTVTEALEHFSWQWFDLTAAVV